MRNPECTNCDLHKEAQTVCVWGESSSSTDPDPHRAIMFIGEAPGKQEDIEGKPFVGAAGKLLRRYIKTYGIGSYYITNIVKCRPPDNRTPTLDEIFSCSTYGGSEVDIVNPSIIVPLGNTALNVLLLKTGISKYHGTWHEEYGRTLYPMYHPAYILRNKHMEDEYEAAFEALSYAYIDKEYV